MDYTIIQKIAKGVLNSSACCDGQLFTGTVSNGNPLQIQLGEDSGDIVLDGDDIILTQSVVSKKVYIKKHTHKIGSEVANHTHNATLTVAGTCSTGSITGTATGTTNPTTDFNQETEIVTNTLEAYCTEYGVKLSVDQDDERTIITLNRGLEKGDKVIMTRVSNGQQFIVLSRYFEVDKQGEDDE